MISRSNEYPYWVKSIDVVIKDTNSTVNGLSNEEANLRLNEFGLNSLKEKEKENQLVIAFNQFKNPLVLLLIFSAFLALLTGDQLDGLIIIIIVLLSTFLGFYQENSARIAITKLISIIKTTTTVLRDGEKIEIPIENITVGDVVFLGAGDIVPGDCRIIEVNNLFVNESTLTGETFPQEKSTNIISLESSINNRSNSLFMGTFITSGLTKAIVVKTSFKTEFGKISHRLKEKPPLPNFEQGIRRFGLNLTELVFVITLIIFAINIVLDKPISDSFLFSLVLAISLTPELLPTIITISMANGAKSMAKKKVLVRKLSAIENLGSMNVFCSDKTGTLTNGILELISYPDIGENNSEKVLLYGYLNAFFQNGYKNPIDEAIRSSKPLQISKYSKITEIPYDFVRKRLSVILQSDKQNLGLETENIMITKGTFSKIIEICSHIEINKRILILNEENRENVFRIFENFTNKGLRTIGVAYKHIAHRDLKSDSLESDMVFLGFLCFNDSPKTGIKDVLKELKDLGVKTKVISGDNEKVVLHSAKEIGLTNLNILTGPKMRELNDEALLHNVNTIDLFAEIEPNQKERIILALRKSGYVVGYMGDGINDATALHAADIGISVNNAVDVTKETADVVLLEKDLEVLIDGITEGRKTFANTMKYILITISANFGNMISMAIASIILPFLPLLPVQVLSINFLTDIPSTLLPTDKVDQDLIINPKNWDIKFITEFMITFGVVSTLIDFISFIFLFYILKSTESQFQTSWFILSVLSELLILLVIRTKRPFYKSLPHKNFLVAIFIIAFITLMIPYSPLGTIIGLIPIPLIMIFTIFSLIIFYTAITEIEKKIFYGYVGFSYV